MNSLFNNNIRFQTINIMNCVSTAVNIERLQIFTEKNLKNLNNFSSNKIHDTCLHNFNLFAFNYRMPTEFGSLNSVCIFKSYSSFTDHNEEPSHVSPILYSIHY